MKDILIVLKMIQKFGSKHEILPMAEWSVKFPTEQKKNVLEVLSIANQKKIMQYVKENFTFRNLGVYVCLSTGMRIGEICGLKWSDINLITETISVNRTIERIYIIDGGKRHTELITSTPKTQNSLREIPMNRELLKLIKPLKKLMNNDYFVLTNEAKPTEPRTYRNYYKSILQNLKIPLLKFQGFLLFLSKSFNPLRLAEHRLVPLFSAKTEGQLKLRN